MRLSLLLGFVLEHTKMRLPILMTLPREGFYIDPLAKFCRVTIFNPAITGTILFIGLITSYLRLSVSTFDNHYHVLELFTVLTVIGVLLDGNDYLTDGYQNNWIEDSSWDWDKETVLVTGGSSGIGASVAQELIARNPKTRIVVIDYADLTFVVPPKSALHFYRCDLTNADEIRSVCARVREEVGDPTVLFNNAGLTRGATVLEGKYSDVQVTFRTNIIAPFLLLKEFLPAMVRNDHGHIVATSSMSSVITPAGLADYAATKAGLAALHEVSRLPLRRLRC